MHGLNFICHVSQLINPKTAKSSESKLLKKKECVPGGFRSLNLTIRSGVRYDCATASSHTRSCTKLQYIMKQSSLACCIDTFQDIAVAAPAWEPIIVEKIKCNHMQYNIRLGRQAKSSSAFNCTFSNNNRFAQTPAAINCKAFTQTKRTHSMDTQSLLCSKGKALHRSLEQNQAR